MMRWSEVAAAVPAMQIAGRGDVEIGGVHYDSRRVNAGDLFVAMRGETTDGNSYIDAAIRRGARAVVTDSADVFAELRERQPELSLGLVAHGRRGLAEISAAVFGRPQDKLRISAVTGTNGKTTTAFLLTQLLESVGRRCLLIGTIETRLAGAVRASEHTTPESRDLLALFAEAVRAGCTEVVMEMSSHALEQERVWGIAVDVAIFTNLTQDHLDFHGTMENYFEAKAKLFHGVGAPPPRIAVINDIDGYDRSMVDEYKGTNPIVVYGECGRGAENHCFDKIKLMSGGTAFRFHTRYSSIEVRSPLLGRVNVENLVAAMCAALARGLMLEEIERAIPNLRQVPGRFEGVRQPVARAFTVIVDYAHTDDALKNLIALARDLVQPSQGRVITLFGCGGDRDRSKRPKMGRVAGEGSDVVVLTSDNPRSESPHAILDEVLIGLRGTSAECIVEVDRRAAIALALRAARPGDIVLLAGKGHEKTQTSADGPVPFDDVAEAEQALSQLHDLSGGKVAEQVRA